MRTNKYLDELMSYGGELYSRGEVIADMQASGTPAALHRPLAPRQGIRPATNRQQIDSSAMADWNAP